MNICGSSPVISIIVPVYKTEKYLYRCIGSILAQTFTDFECILVDDGSPDNCPAICDEYMEKDKRIVVIHQENKGVSAARNAGLDIAKGEWIGFVDSDDWCEEGMYEILYQNAKRHDADMSMCGMYEIKNEYEQKQRKMPAYSMLLSSLYDMLGFMFSTTGFGGFSMNKLVNRELLGESRYNTNYSYLEDEYFFYEIFKKCRAIYYDPIPLYYYFKSPESVTMGYGLTAQVKTGFNVYDKMLSSEHNKRIRRIILAANAGFARNIALWYVWTHDHHDPDFHILRIRYFKHFLFRIFNKYDTFVDKIRDLYIIFPRIYCLREWLLPRKQ
jgi:glycosyltransferase involved in cell wall biosynthesis